MKLAPLSDDNKTKIQEAMNNRYVPGNKALDLSDFGADKTFGGSSNAIGRLTDERVMDVVIDTITEHLSDLQALNLSNNNLRTLRGNLFLSTVKLDFKELLNKEQIDFKELFTDYQLFYTINLLLNKELLPIEEMPKLALRNFRS